MFLSNLRKSFIASTLLLIGCSACWIWQKNENKPVPLINEEKSGTPFSTKEPEIFQCEVVTTTGDSSTSYFFARKQGKWRYDLRYGDTDQVSEVLDDKDYLISYRKKTYAERPPDNNKEGENSSLEEFTSGLLNQGHSTGFQEIGRENNLVRYHARINDSDTSEVVITFDPIIGLPVKQEFYSIAGEKKTLAFTVELRNFTPDVDDSVFAVPAGFRKVSVDEFRKAR